MANVAKRKLFPPVGRVATAKLALPWQPVALCYLPSNQKVTLGILGSRMPWVADCQFLL